jgi:hypothetical protein
MAEVVCAHPKKIGERGRNRFCKRLYTHRPCDTNRRRVRVVQKMLMMVLGSEGLVVVAVPALVPGVSRGWQIYRTWTLPQGNGHLGLVG